ncbi:Nucleoid occlusion protein [Sphingomonas sp. S2M10]|uniref:ParB/RepB/Spo0J family partition protein n=1 Tax=Sphingomonas sp. S2M10 TaxID=2705010 RepID=UPI0014565149|nr:ParB/RepB/Spo0J family partition protein [Sphingomonas sp. S2M10]NLS26217.1 Nucleoid occlusion protein [Sphingomonas sp. S2M10]
MTVRTFVIGQLCVSPYNVRTDRRAIAAIDALKASILQRGLLMPLVVHPMLGNPKQFGAIAGGRRYRALKALVGEGKLPTDYPIEAVVREGLTEAQLIEISTAENLIRRDLYPYETYAALARAARRGSSLEQIADSLGQDVDWVRAGVRLGQLPEPIFKAYADEKIAIAVAKAFAATDDRDAQLEAWKAFEQLPAHQWTAQLVHSLLKVGDRELTNLLHYVGEEAYRNAGGRFELDLFADAGDVRGRVSDEGLLRRLAGEKLDQLRKRIRARTGRELRFAASPPTNDYNRIDSALQIHPNIDVLSAEDAARQQQLLDRNLALLAAANELVDDADRPLPGTEAQIAALDAEFKPNEVEIERLEDLRAIHLPEGDVIATVDIDEQGEADVRFWWASRKAQAAATKPVPSPAPRSTGMRALRPEPQAGAKPLADGAAIERRNDDWTARDRADRQAKGDYGLTQDGVQAMRSLRRSMLRTVLLQDHFDGGTVARDYFVWAQLRMLLTSAGTASTGMRRISPLSIVEQREDAAGAELIDASTAGMFEEALAQVKGWRCFVLPDLPIAFANFRTLEADMKEQAAALLACLALERSLNADGYRIPLQDVVAVETELAGDLMRGIGALTPSPELFNLFDANHRLELAIPFVGRDTVASWSKRKTAEQNLRVAAIFTGDCAEVLTTDLYAAAARWVHPLLAFDADRLEQKAAAE